MKRATYKEVSRVLLKIFERRRKSNNKNTSTKLEGADFNYTDYRDFFAKGETLDIWGDFVVPGSDELKAKLIYSSIYNKVYLATSITEYFFWFIPFIYAEYVIALPEDKIYDIENFYKNFTANDAVKYIATADKWNINHKMKYQETIMYSSINRLVILALFIMTVVVMIIII